MTPIGAGFPLAIDLSDRLHPPLLLILYNLIYKVYGQIHPSKPYKNLIYKVKNLIYKVKNLVYKVLNLIDITLL